MNPILFLAGRLNARAYYRVTQLRYRVPLFGRILTLLGNRIRNRNGIIQRGLAAGLRFNTGNSIAGYLLGTQEPQVQAVCARLIRPAMTVFDLGANVGFLSIIFARLVGPQGRVVCFEPLASNVRQIEYNAQLNDMNNIKVRCEAAGRADGKVVFNASDFPTIGKLEEIQKVQHGEVSGTRVEVQMRSIDSVISDGEAVPDFIKMDIEGAETECLRGMAALLSNRRPLLLIEVHSTNQGVQDLLEEKDYQIAVIGSPLDLASSHWNVQVVAYPREWPMPAQDFAAITNPKLLA